MKRIHRLFALVLTLCYTAAILMISAMAAGESDEQQMIRFEDGSYVIITIEYRQPQEGAVPFSSRYSVEGSKSYDYYNSSDELAWEFSVHGTFTYDGSTAEATDADYSYEIYDSAWSFRKGSASYSGATATATGSFKLLLSHSVTVSLTCSPKGVLS